MFWKPWSLCRLSKNKQGNAWKIAAPWSWATSPGKDLLSPCRLSYVESWHYKVRLLTPMWVFILFFIFYLFFKSIFQVPSPFWLTKNPLTHSSILGCHVPGCCGIFFVILYFKLNLFRIFYKSWTQNMLYCLWIFLDFYDVTLIDFMWFLRLV